MKLIESVEGVNELVRTIKNGTKNCEETLILGVDCEGIWKGRPLSLIQVCVEDEVYVIDLFKVNPFIYGMQEIMEDLYIVKVFHDFCEDSAALVNQYGVYCNRVFDTQIAHRILIDAYWSDGAKKDYAHNNASLNELLRRYLNKMNDYKDLIQAEMNKDKNFWEIRPLTSEMILYASQDVIFLPYLYKTFCYLFEQCLARENYSLIGKTLWETSDVFNEAMKCNDYAQINQTVLKLNSGDVIQAFIKNIQKFGIYCSLNLGITGFINQKTQNKYLLNNYKIGDIIDVTVDRICKKTNKVLLKAVEISDEIDYSSNPMDLSYQNIYYDDSSFNDQFYAEQDFMLNMNEDEFSKPTFYQKYDISSQQIPSSSVQNLNYEQLIVTPEIGGSYPEAKQSNSLQYYAPEYINYQPYLSEAKNIISAPYSLQNLRKYYTKLDSNYDDFCE